MNERLAELRANIAASFQRTKAFYSSHRTLLLTGLTLVSILLIVWARLGFTLQFGRSFAGSTDCTNQSGYCFDSTAESCTPSSYQTDFSTQECSGMGGGYACCVPGAQS